MLLLPIQRPNRRRCHRRPRRPSRRRCRRRRRRRCVRGRGCRLRSIWRSASSFCSAASAFCCSSRTARWRPAICACSTKASCFTAGDPGIAPARRCRAAATRAGRPAAIARDSVKSTARRTRLASVRCRVSSCVTLASSRFTSSLREAAVALQIGEQRDELDVLDGVRRRSGRGGRRRQRGTRGRRDGDCLRRRRRAGAPAGGGRGLATIGGSTGSIGGYSTSGDGTCTRLGRVLLLGVMRRLAARWRNPRATRHAASAHAARRARRHFGLPTVTGERGPGPASRACRASATAEASRRKRTPR